MKQFRILGLFACLAVFALVSCKGDGATADTSATPAATVANQSVTPNPATKVDAAKANEPAVPVGPLTTMSFDETSFDFGEVMEGEKVVHEYKFTNTLNLRE